LLLPLSFFYTYMYRAFEHKNIFLYCSLVSSFDIYEKKREKERKKEWWWGPMFSCRLTKKQHRRTEKMMKKYCRAASTLMNQQ
jgi:hypothetical protein